MTKETVVLFDGEIEMRGSEPGTDTDGGSDCGGDGSGSGENGG